MTDGTAAPGAADTGGNGGGEKPWFDGADAETVGYITNRGLDKVDVKQAALKAIEFHRNAEKKLGGPADRLLRIPTDVADADGWNAIHTALGKPKDKTGYDFSAAKEADETFVNFVREFSFKHNLPKGVGEALATEFTKYAGELDGNEGKEKAVTVAREQEELKREWGFNYTAKMLTAKNAVEKLGIDPKAVAALEGQVGYKAVISMFEKIGGAIGEARYITSEHTGNTMTSDGAKEKIAQLKSDPTWAAKYLAGDKKALQEMTDLTRLSLGMNR